MKTLLVSAVALSLFAGAAAASPIFDKLNETAPRADVFTTLNESAPRSPFETLNETAPRSPFDKLNEQAPRSFGQLNDQAP